MARATGKDPLALALAALSSRERSEAELRDLLERRGVEPDAIEAVLAQLIACGQVDDLRFARMYAEDKREIAGWGSGRIAAALADRGVARETIERTVGDDGDYDAELARARKLLERRGEALDHDAARARALGFLSRRGYEYELAYEAIRGLDGGLDHAA